MSQLEVRPAEADGTSLQIIAFTERLERSEDLIARQAKEIENLTKSLDTLERTVEDLRDLAKYTLSTLSKRVTSLEDVKAQVRPQKLQAARGEILRTLLAANNGKMLASDARHRMGISKSAFSLLLGTLKDKIETKPLKSDRRKMLILLKSSN
jgi:ABC-type transporter Mla subunit MlaD